MTTTIPSPTTSGPPPSLTQAASSTVLASNYRIGMDHLRAYVAREEHANVPQRYVTDDGFKLGSWVVQRRYDRKVGRVSTAKIAELNALGMVWDPREANYRIGVAHLRSYIAREGHANVPRGYVTEDGFRLGNWARQRQQDHKAGILSTVRIAELTALGIVWNSLEANYRIGVDHLRAHIAQEGHANVPQESVTADGFTLGVWVSQRRRERKENTLSTARIAELNTLGMVWDALDANYRIGVDHLRVYVARKGHANVSAAHEADDGFTLGAWMGRRRNERRAGRLSTVRIAELNTLGMVWDPLDANYRIGVDNLRAYIAREGHANVHRKFVTDDGFTLGSWVNNRRHDHKIGRVSTERIAELNALGMVWGSFRASRSAGYRTGVDHLRAYTATQGHVNVPWEYVADDGFKLGAWVSRRRQDHRIGRLTTVRIAELNALGMVWGIRDAGYQIGVAHLRTYTAAQGHANVHRKFVTDDGFTLGAWVNTRRHDRRIGRLSAARTAELNALGMVWSPRAA